MICVYKHIYLPCIFHLYQNGKNYSEVGRIGMAKYEGTGFEVPAKSTGPLFSVG
jgi:hypothetical protein